VSDRFTTFRSTFEALSYMPATDMKAAYIMIGRYALDGILPEPEETSAYGMFCSVKPLIDTSIKRTKAGRSGGEASEKQTASKPEANCKQSGSKPEANCKQTDDVKIKDKSIKIKENNLNTLSGKPTIPYEEIIDYLNLKAGTHYRATSKDTRELIKARFKDFTLEDFKTVIDNRCAAWLNDPHMVEYLRPKTLFGTKFESYLNAPQRTGPVAVERTSPPHNRFNNFQQRDYDYAELEKALLGSQRRDYEQTAEAADSTPEGF